MCIRKRRKKVLRHEAPESNTLDTLKNQRTRRMAKMIKQGSYANRPYACTKVF